MVWNRVYHYLRYCTAAWLAVLGLAAAEHHGTVKFAGLPVPGATVTATQADKKLVAVTDTQGAYSFPDLADGIWTIQVEMLCFTPIKEDVAIAQAAPSPVWELKLQPLDAIKAIAAAAPPPTKAANPVKGQDAAGNQTAQARQTAAAQPSKPEKPAARPKGAPPTPTTGAGGFQRTGLTASSAAPADAAAAPPPTPGADMAAAAPTGETASDVFAINGSSNNGAASRFAQTPAFGNFRRGPGGLYHGMLSGTFGNSALDARQFSVTGQDTPKLGYNHVTGNLSVGGPLIIPHLIPARQNNIIFFINYAYGRNRNPNPIQPTLMPTGLERNGDFSQALAANGQPVVVVDPSTGQPFPGALIPQNRISSQAKALLGFYPLPNFNADSRYNFQTPIVSIGNQDAINSRLSKTLNNKNQVSGLFAYQRNDTETPNLFGFQDKTGTTGLNTNADWRHRVSNRLFAHLQYQFSRFSTRITPYFENRENVSGEAGITGNNQDPLNWGPPNLSFSSGIQGLSDAGQSYTRNQTSALSFDTTWNHTPHNITFGGDFRRQQFNYLSQQNARGSFGFTGAATGLDFADFLLGVPDTSQIAFGNADKYFRDSIYDAYITDDWRATPSFTLNAGVRWEYTAPITELYGRLVNLDYTKGFAAAAPVVANSPLGPLTGMTYPSSLVHPDKHGFQPAVGFSWRPISGSSMVVRGGYRINYNTSVYQSIANQMAQQSPLSKTLSVQNSAADPLTLANGFNASPGVTPNTFAIDPNFRVGYVHNWQLSVQEDLPAAMILRVTYLGIKGTRAVQAFYPNTYPVGAVTPCPDCPVGAIYMTSNGNSTREAGQVQLRRRLHNGFTATLEYTFAKAIDDAVLGGRASGGSLVAQNWLDLSAERGLSNFDQRHLLSLQLQYTTGVGIGGGTLLGGWRGTLLKEWTMVSQITAGSGLPLNPIYPVAVPGTGFTGIRPEYTGAPLYSPPSGLFLNPAAYIAPPSGFWGDAGRNSITGPAQFALIASAQRTFRLRDRINADLRFDATNALNHVTFQSWNTTLNTQFGLPSAANAMRSLQATLRIRF